MYNTCEPEKNYKNKIKTTFGPPLLPIKYQHKTSPLTNLRGVRTPPPSGSALGLQHHHKPSRVSCSSMASLGLFTSYTISGPHLARGDSGVFMSVLCGRISNSHYSATLLVSMVALIARNSYSILIMIHLDVECICGQNKAQPVRN